MAPKPEKTEAQLAAEKQEAERRAALTDEQRQEEDRRAAMSQDERDREDLADLEAQQRAENDAARGGPAGLGGGGSSLSRDALVRRIQAREKAKRDAEATEEVTIARGRQVFTEAGQTQPHVGGTKIKVTPEEAARLRAAGHIVNPETNTVTEPTGPRVFQESGLIEGHGPGQGTKPSSGKSSK